MKNIILLFSFLFFSHSFSQEYRASYAVTVIENKESKLEKMMLEMNSSANSIIKEFNFFLEFDKDQSLFYFEEKLYSDENAVKIGQLKLKYTGEILQTNDSIFKSFNFGEKKHLVGSQKNKEWTISNETKKIDLFLCYKATLVDVVENANGRFEHPITAWFCPEIPFAFGPLKFGGLPGLIIELQTKDGVFGLKSLSKNTENIELKKFQSQKNIISETDVRKLIKAEK